MKRKFSCSIIAGLALITMLAANESFAADSKVELLREIGAICRGGETLKVDGQRATISYDNKTVNLSVGASNTLEIRQGGSLIDQINDYTAEKYQKCLESTIKALGLSLGDSSLQLELNLNTDDGNRLVDAVHDGKNFETVLSSINNPNVVNSKGEVPLVQAAQIGDLGVVLALLEKGAAPNLGEFDTVLGGFRHALGMAALITEKSVSRTSYWRKDGFEMRSSQDAAFCRQLVISKVQIVQALMARGANVEGDANRRYFTPLMNAASSDVCDMTEILGVLKASGAQVNAIRQNRYGNTSALELAVKFGMFSSVKWLLTNGADPSFRSMGGDTPLHDLVKMMGPVFNPTEPDRIGDQLCDDDSDNATTLKFRALLDAGAKIDTQNVAGQTPMALLLDKLGGRCARPECQGHGQVGYRLCYERMMRHVRDKPPIKIR